MIPDFTHVPAVDASGFSVLVVAVPHSRAGLDFSFERKCESLALEECGSLFDVLVDREVGAVFGVDDEEEEHEVL